MKSAMYCPAVDVQAYMDRIESIVYEHGVFIQYVGASSTKAAFGYTVGLFLVDHPEFVIVDLPLKAAHPLLNDLAFSVLRSGMRYGAGDRIHRLISDGFAQLVAVTDSDSVVRAAYELRDRRRNEDVDLEVPALQAAFQDDVGRWPWEEQSNDDRLLLLGDPPEPGIGIDRYLPEAATRRADGW
jgi:hypothetical protein